MPSPSKSRKTAKQTSLTTPESKYPPSAPEFPLFPNLPLEIRRKIWSLTISSPRVLKVIRKSPPSTKTQQYQVLPASYGGHHPAALSVNAESRSEALYHLTPLWGAYWNLKLDVPYLECRWKDNDAITQLAEMRRSGVLDRFECLAIDMVYWHMLSNTMEFRCSFLDRFSAWENPFKSLNGLPKVKKVVFVVTDHTMQEDVVKPYSSWYLGPLNSEVCLCDEFQFWEEGARRCVEGRREELERDIEIGFMGIHGREREFLPKDKLKRPIQHWQMDWFG